MQSIRPEDRDRDSEILTLMLNCARESRGDAFMDAYIAKLVVAWVRKHLDEFTVGHVFLAEMGVEPETDESDD